MKLWSIALACACLITGQAMAESELADFAKAREARIAKICKAEKTPRGKLRREAIQRNDYERALVERREALIASGTLSTPELEALREERKGLERQLQDLDRRIAEASEKAPEVVELDAVRRANAERIAAIKDTLSPQARRAQGDDGEAKAE